MHTPYPICLISMPFKVVCRKCRYVLYKGHDPPPLSILLNKVRKCPKCGRRLRFDGLSSIVIGVKERKFMK